MAHSQVNVRPNLIAIDRDINIGHFNLVAETKKLCMTFVGRAVSGLRLAIFPAVFALSALAASHRKAVAALLKGFAQRCDLNPLVDRRGRMGGIQQLLLAQTDPLQAFCRNLERGHERAADRVGSFLA